MLASDSDVGVLEAGNTMIPGDIVGSRTEEVVMETTEEKGIERRAARTCNPVLGDLTEGAVPITND